MKTRLKLLALALFFATASAFAYTAQFHAGAGTVDGQSDFSKSEASDGAGVTLPTPTLSGCTGWEFAGWMARSTPYEAADELKQELFRGGSVYNLSSVSEEFYAVYRYNTDRYCEINVNDQLITGAQYIVVNDVDFTGTIRYNGRNYSYSINYPVIYPHADGISGLSIRSAYTTWDDGFVDINSSNTLTDAQKQSIIYVLTETNSTNHYWSLYNPYTEFYLDLENLKGISSYSNNADGVLTRSDWYKFTMAGAISGYNIGFYEDPLNYRNFHENFFVLRQQTIFTSTPDCSASNYTVTLNPGANGTCARTSITETGYHQGVVLPAATPNTGSTACSALWEFAGWTESGSALAKDSTGLPKRLFLEGEVYYPERDETLHAVYRRKSTTWEQVEDPNTLQAGENILIAYNAGGSYYVLSSEEAAVGYNKSETIGTSALASSDNAALVWTLEGKKGAWRLKDSNGKHLDMTRGDYAYSYTYPWSRWSDEFTISGEINFSIHSNYADKHYLIANATRFSSSATANTNIHIYRQVTTYSKTPKCETYTVLFNSGEGTFNGVKDATVAVENVSSISGLALNNASVPTAVAPNCDDWRFSGWRVGSGLNATTDAPGVLYHSTDTYIPMQDSVTLFAVYQQGEGEVYYEKVSTQSEITAGGTYVIVNTYNGTNWAVTYNNSNSQWIGTNVTIATNRISTNVDPNMQWTYNGTYFYRGTDNTTYRLANNGNADYAGQVTNNDSPFKLQYTVEGWFYDTDYYLRWRTNGNPKNCFVYGTDNNNNTFTIYKQKTNVPHNSWPHCTAFTVVLNACGGTFGAKDTIHVREAVAGDGISLSGKTPTTTCSSNGWLLVGWVEKKPVQARTTAPVGLIATTGTYSPKQDMDQLYAVYSNGTLWSSYPACGEGVEVIEWKTDGIVVESYTLSGTPSLNGKNGSANGDGTYTLSYDVASNPCTPLLIQWGTVSQIVKTPLLVSTYTRTSAVTSAVDDCSDCDLVVLNGGTAVVDENKTVHDVSVYGGGRFTLSSGKTITASSLTMRTYGDELAPVALIQGTLNCSTLNHDRRIDNSRYYWIALPYDVTIANIDYANPSSNAKNAVYDTDYYMQFYDGVARAADKGKSGTYWTHIADGDGSVQSKTTLDAGRGYLLGLPKSKQNATGHKYRTLRFPMTVANWTTEKNVQKTISVKGADCDWPQHRGWNLIGNPFLQNYSAVTVSDVAGGKLTEYYNDDEQWVEPWYTLEDGTESVPYVSVYDPSSNSYTQTRFVGQNIAPFSAVFVQLSGGMTGLQFNKTAVSKSSLPARRMGLWNEEEENSEFNIHAYAENGQDVFTLIVDDQYNAEYEVGADLLKIQNAGKMNIYAHHDNVERAFDALDYAHTDSIPVGLVMPAAGQVMISAEKIQVADEVEALWLIDNETMTQTDLLNDYYVLTSEAGIYNGRLWIHIGRRSEIPTAIPFVSGEGREGAIKFIHNGQLFILRDGKLYNAAGIQVK